MSENQEPPQHLSDSQSLPPPPPLAPSSFRVVPAQGARLEAIAKVALAVALIASFMPWARVLFITVNGTDGDGVITALTSGTALFLVFAGERRTVANRKPFGMFAWGAAAATLTAFIYAYDFANVNSLSNETPDEVFEVSVQPQLGLIVGMLGAIVSAVVTIQLAVRHRNRRSRT